jgi:hypothetical protein
MNAFAVDDGPDRSETKNADGDARTKAGRTVIHNPRVTIHPTGEKQAAENSENEPAA